MRKKHFYIESIALLYCCVYASDITEWNSQETRHLSPIPGESIGSCNNFSEVSVTATPRVYWSRRVDFASVVFRVVFFRFCGVDGEFFVLLIGIFIVYFLFSHVPRKLFGFES